MDAEGGGGDELCVRLPTCRQVSLYCEECNGDYCEVCWKVVHSIGLLQIHSPLPLSQKNGTIYCSTHLRNRMELFCVPCDKLICDLCL